MHFLIQTKSWSSAWNRLSTVSKLNQVISQRVLRKTLARFDINVTDEMIKRTEEYISMYILQFGDKIYTMKTNSANGWNDDCTEFYCGEQLITKTGLVSVVSTIEDPKVIEPFHKNGTLEGWCKAVQPTLEFRMPRFIFYDAMTAPLFK